MKYMISDVVSVLVMSPSMRREWIEMIVSIGDTAPVSLSPSMRREWIEIRS